MPDTTTDQTMPTGRWEFDEDVTEVFDDMLARSIPQYEVMRSLVSTLAARYLAPGSSVLDLGCSRGQALKRLLEVAPETLCFGVEVSPPMLAAARAEFEDDPRVLIIKADLREGLPLLVRTPSVILAVLTLQFTPIEYRTQILHECYELLPDGGALIVVEKVLGSSQHMHEAFVETYHASKRHEGYSEESVERKRLALEGVLVPVTAKWNEDLLRDAGFESVECVWRWCNFAGWLAVKG